MLKQIVKTVLMSIGLSMLCLALYLALARPDGFTHYELFMTFFSCTTIVLITMSDLFKVVRVHREKPTPNGTAAVNDKPKDKDKEKKNDGKAVNF